MKKIIAVVFLILFCCVGCEKSARAQRVGRMGVLVKDVTGDDNFVMSLDFQNTSVSIGSSADATIDMSVSSGWTQDTINEYIYTTDPNYHVGIGETTPDYKLHIKDAEFVPLYIEGSNADKTSIVIDATADASVVFKDSGTSKWSLGFDNSDSDKFKIGQNVNVSVNTRFTINESGLVGINDSTPDGQLDITNGAAARIALDIDGAAAQSANIVDIDDATGDALFTIDADGDVGIGTNTPDTGLHILRSGGTVSAIELEGDTDSRIVFDKQTTDHWSIGLDTSESHIFVFANGATLSTNPRMAITTGGSVGIGTNDPNVPLQVDGKIRTSASEWYQCHYLDAFSLSAGGSGATFQAPSSNTVGGYNLDADGEYLYGSFHVCDDWDEASDIQINIIFETDQSADAGDEVIFDSIVYFKGENESTVKLQYPTVTEDVSGDVQYTQEISTLTVDYDDATQDVDIGDQFTLRLNFDATNSGISDVIVNQFTMQYKTNQVNREVN